MLQRAWPAGCSLAVIHAPGMICHGASLATGLAALIACYRLRILMKKDYIKLGVCGCAFARMHGYANVLVCLPVCLFLVSLPPSHHLFFLPPAVPLVAENRCFVAAFASAARARPLDICVAACASRPRPRRTSIPNEGGEGARAPAGPAPASTPSWAETEAKYRACNLHGWPFEAAPRWKGRRYHQLILQKQRDSKAK